MTYHGTCLLAATSHLPAMNDNRARLHKIDAAVRQLRLIDQVQHATRHFWHFTFDRWPSVVLELRHLDCVLDFKIGNIELAPCVVRTRFALHVFDKYVIVFNFVIGPISWTFARSFANLQMQSEIG